MVNPGHRRRSCPRRSATRSELTQTRRSRASRKRFGGIGIAVANGIKGAPVARRRSYWLAESVSTATTPTQGCKILTNGTTRQTQVDNSMTVRSIRPLSSSERLSGYMSIFPTMTSTRSSITGGEASATRSGMLAAGTNIGWRRQRPQAGTIRHATPGRPARREVEPAGLGTAAARSGVDAACSSRPRFHWRSP